MRQRESQDVGNKEFPGGYPATRYLLEQFHLLAGNAMLSDYFLKTKQPRATSFSDLAKADHLLAISTLLPLSAGAWANSSAFSCLVAGKTIPWLPFSPRIAVRK